MQETCFRSESLQYSNITRELLNTQYSTVNSSKKLGTRRMGGVVEGAKKSHILWLQGNHYVFLQLHSFGIC